MKSFRLFFMIILLITTFQNTKAQQLLTELPVTKEQFIASEPNVLATIDWLENTPFNQEQDKRKQLNATFIAWLTNAPTVTLEINADVLTFTKKNPDLLVIFMGGWTRYALQNNYSKDITAGTIAGIRSAVKVYKTGLFKKDKELQSLVDLEEKGELENWVKNKLSKK